MIHPIFIVKIKGGRIFWDAKERQKFDLYNSHFKDGEGEITIRKRRKIRTTGKVWEKSNQNGYLFGVVIPIIQEHPQFMGWSKDEVLHLLKFKFLRTGGSDENPKIKGSSTLNTMEWEEWMSKIRMWSEETLEMYIPEPNEVSWD